jgi:hypothetical protein
MKQLLHLGELQCISVWVPCKDGWPPRFAECVADSCIRTQQRGNDVFRYSAKEWWHHYTNCLKLTTLLHVLYTLSTFSSLNSHAQLLKRHLLWDRVSINRPFLYAIDNNTLLEMKKVFTTVEKAILNTKSIYNSKVMGNWRNKDNYPLQSAQETRKKLRIGAYQLCQISLSASTHL